MVKMRKIEPQLQTAAEDYAINWREARKAKEPEARDSANKAMDDTLAAVPPDERSEVVMQAQRIIFLGKIPDRPTVTSKTTKRSGAAKKAAPKASETTPQRV